MFERAGIKKQAKQSIGALGGKLLGFSIFIIIALNIMDFIISARTPVINTLYYSLPNFTTVEEFYEYMKEYVLYSVPLVVRALMQVYSVFTTILQVGFQKTCLMASRGEKPVFRNLFDGFDFWLKIIGADILMGLAIGVASIFFVVPGIILALAWSQTYFVMIDHPEYSITRAMRESRTMMRGHKANFLVFQLSFILWNILSSISYGLADIWVLPYSTVSKAVYYNRLTDALPAYDKPSGGAVFDGGEK